jgi:hypothetical protein
MSISNLLNKLNKVKSNGNGSWMACCPAHDDKTPSLSIKDNSDGRLMLRCFSGCETIDVLNSIGLDWDDVMPPKQEKPVHIIKPKKHDIYATDALLVIRNESRIITMAAIDVCKGVKIEQAELERIKLAMTRINNVCEAANVK